MKVTAVTLLLNLIVTLVTALTTEELISSNNAFSAAVYKEASKSTNENLLVSPLSAEIVLALTQSGAKDETAREIQTSLRLPQNNEEIKSGFKNFLRLLKSEEEFSLHTANKIYVKENIPIRNEFKSVASDSYGAEIENIDFSKNVEAANIINQWVEGQTQNKIRNLVESSALNSATPAVIVNTLYFKAKWIDNDFHKYPVVKRKFYNSDETEVDTMTNFGAFLEFHDDPVLKAQFLKLPLKGEDAFVIIALPNERNGLSNLEARAEKVLGQRPFKREIVDVTLPLFKIESRVDFKEILIKLGVRKAFSTTEADFSGIAGNKGALAIGGILQKTFINVDQSGVEAAAATDLWFFTSGPPRATKTFKADHPFMFYIQVRGVILFAGKLVAPRR